MEEIRVSAERIRLVEVVGEGRSGRVFVGIDNVLHRRVVVKSLARASFEDNDARRRLIDEARVLSTLDHPNVLRIHDYREQDGHDLFTLEFAAGKSLPDALEAGLDFAAKLRVATAVASVLATAHRSGIVHGALSPQSVLIADNGEIKVVDFQSTTTRLDGPRAGLRWQSPEQARGEPPTRASDMYSFGLLLREMFGERNHGIGTLVQLLLREAPADRTTGAVALERLKRLGKRRMRRLRSGAIALAALAFLFAGVKYTVDLRRERAEAVRALAEAEDRRVQAKEMLAYIIDDLHPKLQDVGRLDLMDAASAQALNYFASLDADALSPREVGSNAMAISQLGLVQAWRGDYANALRTLEKAIVMAEGAVRRDAKDDELHFIAGTVHANLAVGLDKAGRFSEALVQSRIYARIVEDLSRRNPLNERFLKERAYVANHIGTLLDRREESAQALPELELALSIMRRLMASQNDDQMAFEVGLAFAKSGTALLKVGRLAEAQQRLEEGRALLEPRVARSSSPTPMRQLLGVLHDNLAAVALARGDVVAASNHAALERAIMEPLIRFEPENADWSRQMSTALRSGGTASRMSGDVPAALQSHGKAVRILEEALARGRETMLLSREMAVTRTELARSLLAAGRSDAAAESADDAVAVLKPIQDQIVARRALANALLVRGEARAARGDAAGAASAWREALDVLRPLDAISQDPRIADSHASVLMRLGRVEEAQPLIEELAAIGYRNPEFEVLCRSRDVSRELMRKEVRR